MFFNTVNLKLMKLQIKISILACVALFTSEVAFSQSLLNRVKQKTKEKIENRLEDKVDEKIDKGLDKVENSIDTVGDADSDNTSNTEKETARQNRMNSMLKGIGMSGEPVATESSYTFTNLVQMHLEVFDNEENKTSNGEFITLLNPDTESMAYEVVSDDRGNNEQGLFIIDIKNKAILLLNNKDGEKTGFVYGMGTFYEDMKVEDKDQYQGDETLDDVAFSNQDIKKTGKTKTIAGYSCEQYLYTTDEVDSEFWITDELKTSDRDFFSTLYKTSAMTHGMGYGYVMESVSKDKLSGNISKMSVTKVDNNASSKFNLSSYQITNLGTFQLPAEDN